MGYVRVCTGAQRCVLVCMSVCRYAQMYAGMRGCARVCAGVYGMNFQNTYLLETRVLTSVDFHTYPI